MHSAPSVTYPVGRSVFLARLSFGIAGLGLLAVALCVVYGAWSPAALLGLAWCGWAVVAWRSWTRQAQGHLVWRASGDQRRDADSPAGGGAWSWSSAAYQEGVGLRRVERVYDLQVWVLLCLHNPDGARTWVWAERRSDPLRWDDLRRALCAHA